MSLLSYSKLPKDDAGRRILEVLTGAPLATHVSLVDRGANGLPLTIVKSEASPVPTTEGHGNPDPLGATGNPTRIGAFLAWIGSALGMTLTPDQIDKAAAQFPDLAAAPSSTPFELALAELPAWAEVERSAFAEALAPRRLSDALWRGHCALEDAVGVVMRDEGTTDKRAAVAGVLSEFGAYVLSAFDAVPIMIERSEASRAQILAALAMPPASVALAKAGRVLSAASLARTNSAAEAMIAAQAAIQAAIDELEALAASTSTQKGDAMNPQILLLAAQARQALAKASNPQISQAELDRLGQEAITDLLVKANAGTVAKTATAEQPALHTDVLAMQLDAAGFPAMKAKIDELVASIATMGSLVKKCADDLYGRPVQKDGAVVKSADGSDVLDGGLISSVSTLVSALEGGAIVKAGAPAVRPASAPGGAGGGAEQPSLINLGIASSLT
jgi:hypothetical protein